MIHLKLATEIPLDPKQETQAGCKFGPTYVKFNIYKTQMQFFLHGTKTAAELPRSWHMQRGNGAAEARRAGTALGRLHFSRLAMARLQVAE